MNTLLTLNDIEQTLLLETDSEVSVITLADIDEDQEETEVDVE